MPLYSVAGRESGLENPCVAAAPKPVFSVSVRDLVEFALRRGDLGGERDFVGPNRALAGTRGHQRLQRSRPAGYEKEVRLSHDVEDAELILRIQGRIDGILATQGEVLLEEIKTVQSGPVDEADPLHWAQAKLYGYIYAREHSLREIALLLTYLDLDTGEVTEFRETLSRGRPVGLLREHGCASTSTGCGSASAGAGRGTSPSARWHSHSRIIAPASGNSRWPPTACSRAAGGCSSKRPPASARPSRCSSRRSRRWAKASWSASSTSPRARSGERWPRRPLRTCAGPACVCAR